MKCILIIEDTADGGVDFKVLRQKSTQEFNSNATTQSSFYMECCEDYLLAAIKEAKALGLVKIRNEHQEPSACLH